MQKRVFIQVLLAITLAVSASAANTVRASSTQSVQATVVGDGTPESCTTEALYAALIQAGQISFNCGPNPHTIVITQRTIGADTALDGGGLITLAAHGSRHFVVNAGRALAVSNLTLSQGSANGDGGAIFSNGTLMVDHTTFLSNTTAPDFSGGAIVSYGPLTVTSSIFDGNQGGSAGAVYPRHGSVATIVDTVFRNNRTINPNNGYGGAMLVWDGPKVHVVDSTFQNNQAYYGGAIYNLFNSTVTLEGGSLSDNTTLRGGGAIYNAGVMTLTRTSLTTNTAFDFGGGLYNAGGSVYISNSHINQNQLTNSDDDAWGGGIYNTFADLGNGQSREGTVTIEGSEVRGNWAKRGAGIDNRGVLNLSHSLLAQNAAANFGGGLYIDTGTVGIDTSTFSDNTAGYEGAALYKGTGPMTVQFSTFAGNATTAEAGADGSTLFFTLDDAGNTTMTGVVVDGTCVGGTPVSQGYNLERGATCGLSQPSDLQNTDPQLGALADNGGPTQTRAPLPESPALDAGGPACGTTDQRGLPRLAGAACDMGAVEMDYSPTCGGTFNPVADLSLSSAAPDLQQGGLPYLDLVHENGTTSAALLGFDLTGKLSNGVVQQASLELPIDIDNAPAVTDVVDVRSVLGDWDETATWATQPISGASFGTLGLQEVANGAGNFVRVDVTALAIHWANGEISRTSVLLMPAEIEGMNLRLHSRESGSQPRLIVQCALVPTLPTPDSTPADLQQKAAADGLKQGSAEPVSLFYRTDGSGALNQARFEMTAPATATTALAQAEWWLATQRDLLRLTDPEDTFQFTGLSDDEKSVRFRQVHAGVPVFPSGIVVRVDGAGHVVGFNGDYAPEILLAPTPTLTPTLAEQLAQTLHPEWTLLGDTQLRYVAPTLLGDPALSPEVRLAWEVHLGEGSREYSVWIDAHDGQRLAEQRSALPLKLDLRNANGIADSANPCGNWKSLTQWFNENGVVNTNPPTVPSTEGTNVFNNIRTTWNWFRNTTGVARNGHDNKDSTIFVAVQLSDQNAYGGGNCLRFGTGMGTLDIVAHEYGHAVTDASAGLIYSNESGALNESFSDIFGSLVNGNNFLVGTNSTNQRLPNAGVTGCMPGTRAFRDMSNPPCFGQPDLMGNYVTVPITNDSGGVHTNSGIHNKAYWLLTNGGTFNGYTITGIGPGKSAQLMYRMLNNCLTAGSTFFNASVCAVTSEGRDLVDAGVLTTGDMCQIRNAYAATQINTLFSDKDCDGTADLADADQDGDGQPNAKDNCPAVWNPNQRDTDRDGLGDACDDDLDGDTRLNAQDNCPAEPNFGRYTIVRRSGGDGPLQTSLRIRFVDDYQNDFDNDGRGDACDDSDVFLLRPLPDDVVDREDNCRLAYNPDQADTDGDDIGNACDDDDDNDGVADVADNCSLVRNPGQENKDGDPFGDACDLCPATASNDNGDADKDGIGNACDFDADNDSVCNFGGPATDQPGLNPVTKICRPGKGLVNSPFPGIQWPADNCWLIPNEDQMDLDNNKIGFACDPAERAVFWDKVKEINVKYALSALNELRIPVPICPQCGKLDLLPKDFQTRINVSLPANVNARVLDSAGNVVAQSERVAGTRQLSFFPQAFAGKSLRIGGQAQARHTLAEAADYTPLDDDTGYYLALSLATDAPGAEPQEVTMTASVSEGVVPGGQNRLYLPALMR